LPTSRTATAISCPATGTRSENFKDLAQWIGENLRVESAVIDGEIACVDDSGRSIFNDLLFRRRECLFFAFDLLYLNGEDLRGLPLIERKARLKRLLRRKRSQLLYVDHIETVGQRLFEKACDLDREAIVAKRKDSLYRATEKPSPYWIKIKNPDYSQAEGREEFLILRSDSFGRSVLAYKALSTVSVGSASLRLLRSIRPTRCLDQVPEASFACGRREST